MSKQPVPGDVVRNIIKVWLDEEYKKTILEGMEMDIPQEGRSTQAFDTKLQTFIGNILKMSQITRASRDETKIVLRRLQTSLEKQYPIIVTTAEYKLYPHRIDPYMWSWKAGGYKGRAIGQKTQHWAKTQVDKFLEKLDTLNRGLTAPLQFNDKWEFVQLLRWSKNSQSRAFWEWHVGQVGEWW